VTRLLADQVWVRAAPDRIWELVRDPERLAQVLPGCETLRASGPERYEGTFATRLQFLTLRAQVVAQLLELEPPRHLRLELNGRPLGLAGSFVVSVPVDLAPDAEGTLVRYMVDLQVSGRLAAFGLPLLRDTLRRQVAQLVANLERELATPPAAPEPR